MTYDELREEWNNNTTIIRCTTSGSTGTPSLIELPKIQMKRSAERTIKFFNIDSFSHLHSCISPDFIGGKMIWVRAKEAGCKFSFEAPSNHILPGYHGPVIDLVAVVPSQMVTLLNENRELPPVRNYLIGGAPVPISLREEIIKRGICAWESYGMTETSSHIALRKISLEETPFQTLPGITVCSDPLGCLVINIEGWQSFVTHDLAVIHSNHSFEITGRIDNVIISGGKKINPEILEKRLSSLIKCDFAFSSSPDPLWGEKLILVVSGTEEDKNELHKKCASCCERHEIPKEIIKIEKIPLTKNGKIDRKTLKKIIADGAFAPLKLTDNCS